MYKIVVNYVLSNVLFSFSRVGFVLAGQENQDVPLDESNFLFFLSGNDKGKLCVSLVITALFKESKQLHGQQMSHLSQGICRYCKCWVCMFKCWGNKNCFLVDLYLVLY